MTEPTVRDLVLQVRDLAGLAQDAARALLATPLPGDPPPVEQAIEGDPHLRDLVESAQDARAREMVHRAGGPEQAMQSRLCDTLARQADQALLPDPRFRAAAANAAHACRVEPINVSCGARPGEFTTATFVRALATIAGGAPLPYYAAERILATLPYVDRLDTGRYRFSADEPAPVETPAETSADPDQLTVVISRACELAVARGLAPGVFSDGDFHAAWGDVTRAAGMNIAACLRGRGDVHQCGYAFDADVPEEHRRQWCRPSPPA